MNNYVMNYHFNNLFYKERINILQLLTDSASILSFIAYKLIIKLLLIMPMLANVNSVVKIYD